MASTLFRAQRKRTLVGLSLMGAQAFFYNAIFFTYALILTDFYGIRADHVGWYILPFAVGNFLGPIVLGRLFDTLGRRPMLAFTYAVSGLLLALTGYLFAQDLVSASQLTIAWMVIFFFASAAASAAYLTVSETFPLEIRALAIAFFYAIGTGVGGIAGPWLFGVLIETGSRSSVFVGYLIGAALMLAAAIIAGRVGGRRRAQVAGDREPAAGIGRLRRRGPISLQQVSAIVHAGDAAERGAQLVGLQQLSKIGGRRSLAGAGTRRCRGGRPWGQTPRGTSVTWAGQGHGSDPI